MEPGTPDFAAHGTFAGKVPLLLLLAGLVLLTSCGQETQPPLENPPAPATIEIVSGNFQWSDEAGVLADPIVTRVVGPDGRPLAGVPVIFTAICGDGSLSGFYFITDSNGTASVAWTLGTGPESILRAIVADGAYAADPVYLYANSNVRMETRWVSGVPFTFEYGSIPHDDRVLESNAFLVFSDADRDEVKIIVAKMAEEALFHIRALFGVGSNEDLGIVGSDRGTKIRIYSLKNATHLQDATRAAVILYGIESPAFAAWASRRPDFYDVHWFKRELTHELTHVYDYMIGISPFTNLDLWFHEGLAEYTSGGAFPTIDTLAQLEAWRSSPDHSNPILVHRVEDFPVAYERAGEFYPMYHLAVRYLLDERGLGRRYSDVQAMFDQIVTEGASFETAFAAHMGISLDHYEEHFFDLMTNFLEATAARPETAGPEPVSPF